MITALAACDANPQPENRAPLDEAYAEAMREVWQAYPKDADVGAFFAEALMDLRPWDQWTPEGKPQPGTEEVLATLDAVLGGDRKGAIERVKFCPLPFALRLALPIVHEDGRKLRLEFERAVSHVINRGNYRACQPAGQRGPDRAGSDRSVPAKKAHV